MKVPTSIQFRSRCTRFVALASVGFVLAACGSGSGGTTTTTSSGTNTSAIQQLQQITSRASVAEGSTYSAQWTSDEDGVAATITFDQAPPKFLFKVGATGYVLDTGTKLSYCVTSSSCVTISTGTDPLIDVLHLYNGQQFLSSVSAFTSSAILHAESVTLTFSSGTYDSEASSCVTVDNTKVSLDGSNEWCVSNSSGILTYWFAGGNSFTLTKFSTSVPASDF